MLIAHMSFVPRIGILQGRLSASPEGKFQFFPTEWREEFRLAREVGFHCIEWLFDWPDFEKNPLWSESSRKAIRKEIERSGIAASSICADYFMKYKFTGPDTPRSLEVLRILIDAAADIASERLVIIPFLEGNTIKSESEKKELVHNLQGVFEVANRQNVRFAFETELTADELADFVARFPRGNVGVCYDIGNCTSYGFDCPKDIRKLGTKIFDVHLKDRKAGSSQSVLLGTGDADFAGCFAALRDIGYKGACILQAWRGAQYLEDVKTQLAFVQSLLKG